MLGSYRKSSVSGPLCYWRVIAESAKCNPVMYPLPFNLENPLLSIERPAPESHFTVIMEMFSHKGEKFVKIPAS